MAHADVSELEAHLGYWLRFVSNHVSHAFTLKVEARGVTVAEWVLLRELLQADGRKPSDLADKLGMTRGAISKLVERLRRKKLVKRSMAKGDRRFQTVALTVAGRKLVPVLAALADENDREYFGHLGREDASRLVSMLKEVVRRHGWKDVPVS